MIKHSVARTFKKQAEAVRGSKSDINTLRFNEYVKRRKSSCVANISRQHGNRYHNQSRAPTSRRPNEGVIIMTSIMPYGNLDRALRRTWPLDAFDDFFSPLASVSPENVFKMDVEDAGEKYVISAELAGVSRDEIDVELNEGRLSISVNKQESEEEKSKTYLHKETSSWSATRGIYLKDASTSGLTAKLEGGILTVNVPKQTEKENVTKIQID